MAEGFGELCNLKYTTFGGDSLKALPPWFGYLKSLNDLSVSWSPRLTRLPNSFGSLTRLRKLKLWKCGIEYLPQDFAMMKSLEILVVFDCPLRELPWKRVEAETGERDLNKMLSTDDKCMFGLSC